MDDAEINKKIDALVTALAALRSSQSEHLAKDHVFIDKEFQLLSKRLARLERKLSINDGGLKLQTMRFVSDARPLTDKRGK